MKYLKIKLAVACTIIIALLPACAIDIPANSSEYLVAPVITNCERQGDKIIIKFSGYNNEYYFDGYNVYVSDSSLNSEYVSRLKPVQIEGYPSAEPSYPLSPEDYDPEKTRTITLYQYYWLSDGEYVPYPFSPDTTYYIFLCSHHRQGYVLPEGVSNQVSSPGTGRRQTDK
ncbi:MAG: hypothetical protein MUC95_03255 [Spirochaetes bacterium]|jgi:hypothetical protein|nr:hypothetical protein [Spirochaetota bacterium]